ncbi:hypothetical protein [Pusillimonas noertemannii]|uniref:Uncharacterized protein n=1 Tax=Pusillimonas noertemannii TaxID=305977 RepID=A0A2U1CME2_9BURK|nr:hypothetical protein [Pusillimonas noertemannii]NYT68797.1 hypothetical protein [Pusillimonas noertemannii]PVY62179.1 hypothetical protein C7440_1672 [Pusillimonas noertemannii]TFL10833.1 hypothetical protein CSC72_09995 [Pusillimonas noertemannii]
MSINELLRGAMMRPAKPAVVLDDTKKNDGPTLSGADSYAAKDITLRAVATVHQWVETDDLDEGETMADRLLALLVGIADENKDGELSEDEYGVLEIAVNAVGDYLEKQGVAEDDIDALLNDWEGDVADRVRDLVATTLPEGEDAASDDIDSFVFGDDEQEAVLDATYKKTFAIRKGKKTRIRKRVAGTIRLSAKQKMGLRKARMKSHNAGAMMRRAKSMRLRRKMGI